MLESAAVPGVGPQVSRLLRLGLDDAGYARGDVIMLLRDHMTADEALELEAVSVRRRGEVSALSELLTARAKREAAKK